MKILWIFLGFIVFLVILWVVIGMPTNLGLGGWGKADPSKNTQGIPETPRNLEPTDVPRE